MDETRSRSVPKRIGIGEGLLQCGCSMAGDERMTDFHARRAHARGMGGLERLARRRAAVPRVSSTVRKTYGQVSF